MRLPDFLIIGAMKSGTTTLFHDLLANPAVFFPADKEPDNLTSDEVLTPRGRAAYQRLYRDAGDEQVCGDASTGYSKLPDHPGVPERALRVLGPGVKIIYLVREPVARTISQHKQELAAGDVDANIDRAVQACPRLVDFSRYAMQITPWIEAFGAPNVRIVRFEDYVADRRGVVSDLSGFLGIPVGTDRIDTGRVYNPGEKMWVRSGALWRLTRSGLYRRCVRPWLSRDTRARLRARLLRRAPSSEAPPSLATVDHILDRVRDDVVRLQRLAGWEQLPWDLAAVRERYAAVERRR
ncbi:MAG: sulfotransferase [Acidobacteriota bacterium]|jgi:hypothetical protein